MLPILPYHGSLGNAGLTNMFYQILARGHNSISQIFNEAVLYG
jgi:hypothetical protein